MQFFLRSVNKFIDYLTLIFMQLFAWGARVANFNGVLGRRYIQRFTPDGATPETPAAQPVQALMLVSTAQGVRKVKYPRMPTDPDDMLNLTKTVAQAFAMGREGVETHIIAERLELEPDYVQYVLQR